jgi:hypothetical protein
MSNDTVINININTLHVNSCSLKMPEILPPCAGILQGVASPPVYHTRRKDDE